MTKANPNHPLGPSEPPPSERLESWKEIAAYLKRGVSTVQRWERQENLPVHRHLHDRLGTVYAYKAELDAWWSNRRPHLEHQDQVNKGFRRRLGWTLAVAAVVVAAGVGFWLARRLPLPFEERDWVLIAHFENRTGEAVFDGTLEYALERELSNSRFVNIAPRERINDTLRLMKKPLDTIIDAAVGREIALRDGGIRALLTGRVEKLDTTYVLNAALVEPGRGVTVASFSEEAEGQSEVVPAIRRLSNRVRETLGEELSSIQQSDEKLAKVTTPSLRALQLFSQGSRLKERREYKVAEELLREAIEEDPDFASAHLWLAYALKNQEQPKEEYLPHAERALELSETVSEQERYFIRGGYHMLAGEFEKAIPPLEALVRLYPEHYFGIANLASAYTRLGRSPEGVPYRIRLTELRPNAFWTNALAALFLVTSQNDWVRARPYFQRAQELASPDVFRRFTFLASKIEAFSWYRYWFEGDLDGALQELDRVARSLGKRRGPERDGPRMSIGFFYVTLGQLKTAEEILQADPDPIARNSSLAFVAFARQDWPAVRKHLRGALYKGAPQWPQDLMLLIRAGFLDEAPDWISALERVGLIGHAITARGELALNRRELPEAIALLEQGVQKTNHTGWPVYFWRAESLARAWQLQGDLAKAVAVLEETSQDKGSAIYPRSGLLWLRIQWQRAKLYRKVGRDAEAREIEAELRKLLAYADPDHPLLRQLNRSQASAATQPPP